MYRPVNRLLYHSSEAHQELKLVVHFSLNCRHALEFSGLTEVARCI